MINMTNRVESDIDNYDKLVQNYNGLCVLIRNGKVNFADKSSKIVYHYAKQHFPDRNWKILRVDSGDAAFYDIEVSCEKNHA